MARRPSKPPRSLFARPVEQPRREPATLGEVLLIGCGFVAWLAVFGPKAWVMIKALLS